MPRPVLLLLTAAFAASGAVWFAPPAPEGSESTTLPPPPTAGFVKALSLGRHAAAADLVWLRTAQFIGAPFSERVLYAGLEHWVSLASDLDPMWERPYFHGSILLATLPGRQAASARILEEAEEKLVTDACRLETACALPDFSDASDVERKCVPCAPLVEQGCNWRVPLSQGFVAYFGQLDAAAAAKYFCESRRRGGPEYLTPFSARLARSGHTCRQLRQDLAGLARQSAEGGSEMLSGQQEQLRIVINCEQEAVKQAALAYNLRKGTWPVTITELLDEGLLDEPPWVPGPGLCWNRRTDAPGFELGPCPTP